MTVDRGEPAEACGCPAGQHDGGEPGGFYVTAKDHGRTAWLLGPYATHEEALGLVAEAKVLARAATGCRSDFWAFGTSRVAGGERPAGKLNERRAAWKASILAEGTLVQYRKVGRGTVTAHACPYGGSYCPQSESHCYLVEFETGRYRGTTEEVWLAPDAVTTRPSRKAARA
jgi:hypothetical protein